MDAQNMQKTPTVMKESKNKIKVDFERTPLKDRLKAKFLSMYFVKNVVWYIFRLVLLIGISYVILFPFWTKIAGSFMAPDDFVDVTVRLIPKHFTLDIYKAIINELNYWEAFVNTLILSASTALIQTFVCCLIAYGLAKFKFKGNKLVFMCVMLTMIVPHQTLQLSLFMEFRYFDILGIFNLLGGGLIESLKVIPFTDLNLTNTYWPMIILSLGGLGFKNGLYIFMLRQFFKGVPDELEESAYIDGSGTFRTFIQIILPLSVPMMITVFLFAFSWQWTDDFYTTLFFTTTKTTLMPDIVDIPKSLETSYAGPEPVLCCNSQHLWIDDHPSVDYHVSFLPALPHPGYRTLRYHRLSQKAKAIRLRTKTMHQAGRTQLSARLLYSGGDAMTGHPIRQQRLIGFDRLRIYAVICVIVLHASSTGWSQLSPASLGWQICNVYDSLVRFCVPVLFMLSGVFFLDSGRSYPLRKLFGHNVLRLLTAYLFWDFAYAAILTLVIPPSRRGQPFGTTSSTVIITCGLFSR